jgi:hypothetical protein
MIPLKLVADSVRQLFVSPVDNDASPSSALAMFVNLDGHQRIGSHPLDLFARHGKRVKVSVRMSIVEGHDIRLPVLRARQVTNAIGYQDFRAFQG